MGNTQRLIDLVLDWQTVTIPPRATLHPETIHAGIACHYILDSSGKDVSVVRKTGGEGWAIVEGVRGVVSLQGKSILSAEGVAFGPVGTGFFFRFGKFDRWGKERHDVGTRFVVMMMMMVVVVVVTIRDATGLILV